MLLSKYKNKKYINEFPLRLPIINGNPIPLDINYIFLYFTFWFSKDRIVLIYGPLSFCLTSFRVRQILFFLHLGINTEYFISEIKENIRTSKKIYSNRQKIY